MRLDLLFGLMAEALVILIVAKLLRDRLLALRGYQVDRSITEGGSLGAAVTQAGYLVGVLLGFMGAIHGHVASEGFLGTLLAVALAGAVAIALQLVADFASDKLIFRGVDEEKTETDNLALAVGKASVSLATGLVLRGALSDPDASFLGRVIWFAVAQAVMVGAVLLYCRLTPYDDLGEIRRKNLAAGFPIAGILLAVGFVMEAAVAGKASSSVGDAALQALKFLGVSLVLVYAFRLITDRVLLPKLKLSQAVVEQKNVAAGLQEGISFVLASLVVTFFLT
jgi:uncharacterized membrane protein YjfL (UPF0719 family)